MIKVLPRPRTIVAALFAGAVAGVLILACYVILTVVVLRTPGFTPAGLFEFDAAALVGNVAYTGGPYVALGIGLHFLVALGWAIGYGFAAERQPQLVTRPIISGAAFGLIVYFAMLLVLVAANAYRTPTPGELGVALLAHLGCFGIPVALIIARSQRSA